MRLTFILKQAKKLKCQLQFQERKMSSSKPVCRICYSDTMTEENPLIQPCKCMGSMKNIHLGCLQRWMASRMNINPESNTEESNVISLLWEGLKCELCLTSLPFQLNFLGKSYDLINFEELFNLEERTMSKYMMLESWSKSNKSIGIFFCDFSRNNLITIV